MDPELELAQKCGFKNFDEIYDRIQAMVAISKEGKTKTEKKNEEDFQDLLKKYDNSENENKGDKKEILADKEYINQLKENMSLKQKTLDDFLKLK